MTVKSYHFFEKSGSTHPMINCHKPEDLRLQQHHCANLKTWHLISVNNEISHCRNVLKGTQLSPRIKNVNRNWQYSSPLCPGDSCHQPGVPCSPLGNPVRFWTNLSTALFARWHDHHYSPGVCSQAEVSVDQYVPEIYKNFDTVRSVYRFWNIYI